MTALLQHGEIKTTLTRAKEMRKYFDKMIGHGKRGTLHARRQALSFVKSKDVVAKLFHEYGPLYKNRNGGYTRIFRLGNRLGDNAQMALIQMVDVKELETGKTSEQDSIQELKEELQKRETITAEDTEIESIETAQVEGTPENASTGEPSQKKETEPTVKKEVPEQ